MFSEWFVRLNYGEEPQSLSKRQQIPLGKDGTAEAPALAPCAASWSHVELGSEAKQGSNLFLLRVSVCPDGAARLSAQGSGTRGAGLRPGELSAVPASGATGFHAPHSREKHPPLFWCWSFIGTDLRFSFKQCWCLRGRV